MITLRALVAAYNAADVVRGAARHVSHVFVVDDGSTDGTVAMAQNAGAAVVMRERNPGKGYALRTVVHNPPDRRHERRRGILNRG